jgi:asparagine synthase (glutamine-hydrolysing)
MCGISGFVDKSSTLNVEQLELYNSVLSHRGPDSNDYFFKQNQNETIGLGHVRLSILDLSDAGKQPMFFENLTIILNGEIYNYKEIQVELIEKGYTFNSTSDTEVVLKSFHAWGKSCVEKFRGMFAFAIYDGLVDKLYLCRDRAGVKPLYYYQDSMQFIFGSELKVFFKTSTFSPQVDTDSLKTFLNYGYVTNNNTILQDVLKVNPGNWVEVSLIDLSSSVSEYWNLGSFFEKDRFVGSFEDAVVETEKIIRESCEYRMISDVPVGVFLSGGFDSTLITSILQKDRTEKIKTFTIGFSDGIDESKDAKKIADYLGTEHTTYDCRQHDAMELIPSLPLIFDDLIADVSCIPTFLVSKLARNEVKVALSADGGDELFGGYNGFKDFPNILQKLNNIPFQNLSANIARLTAPLFQNNLSHLNKKAKGFSKIVTADKYKKVHEILKNNWGLPDEITSKLMGSSPLILDPKQRQVAYKDPMDELFVSGFEDVLANLLLVKVDRATMGVSLEGREPLLDHKLAEFAAQLPFHYKHDGIVSKRPLREIVYKNLPKEMMDRPKIGFDLPIFKWLKEDLSYLIDEYLSDNNLELSGYFSGDYVHQLVKLFRANKLRYPSIIWRLLVFQMWYEEWFVLKK